MRYHRRFDRESLERVPRFTPWTLAYPLNRLVSTSGTRVVRF